MQDIYHRRAEHCHEQAKSAHDRVSKQSWLQMADSWARLAEEAAQGKGDLNSDSQRVLTDEGQ